MSSPCRRERWSVWTQLCALIVSLAMLACAKKDREASAAGVTSPTRKLRVCADPNNLPFSNDRLEGFENKLAELIAREMGAEVEYTWWAQRRGFIRNTLKAGDCDVVMGVPSEYEMALTTAPYYRSSYVFVTRKESGLTIRSFDDPILRRLRIGVQMIGDDFTNSPPAHALADRRIIRNVVGYPVYGNYAEASPTAKIVRAVADREIDAAVVWGPQAGYFASRQARELELAPVSPAVDRSSLPFVFDISLGVRRGDKELKEELESILKDHRQEVARLLAEYGVPLVR